MSSISWIGPIPTKWELFLLCTREWDRRGYLGMEHVCIKIFMYVKSCYKISTFKNDESNSNINICKILHLPFDMLCYFIERIMIPCKIHRYESICPIMISFSMLTCYFFYFEDNQLIPRIDLWGTYTHYCDRLWYWYLCLFVFFIFWRQ